jgi:small subunit ribosomal protein S19
MAKKIFVFRGKTLEQLQALSMEELAPLLSSAFRRKFTRGFTDAEKRFLEKIKDVDSVKTHCRDMFVLPSMVNKTIKIHKGSSFDDVLIQPEMIGHRLGELVLTRKRITHGGMGVGASKGSANKSKK